MPPPVTCELTSGQLTVRWADGSTDRFHPLWLRDNCPSGGARDNAFRTFSAVDLDPDLCVASATVDGGEVVVGFGDGHRSRFDADWLRRHGEARRRPRLLPPCENGGLVEFAAADIDAGGAGHLALLEAVAARGVAVVVDSETTEEATTELAGLFGRIRETDFGRLFDIVFEVDAWTKSQTDHALAPHTDDPYRYTPSGASVMHCVSSSAAGGDSILVDGFAVAGELRRTRPAAFELLSTVAVPFVRHRTEPADQGDDVHLLAHARVIAVDHDGEICGIRFHERSMAPLDLAPEIMGDYYRAFIEMATMVVSPEFSVLRRLRSGEALMFDNQRVLHGRTAFTGGGGRHLRLGTVDRDQFHSRLRRLRETHGRAGVDDRLPVGNLS